MGTPSRIVTLPQSKLKFSDVRQWEWLVSVRLRGSRGNGCPVPLLPSESNATGVFLPPPRGGMGVGHPESRGRGPEPLAPFNFTPISVLVGFFSSFFSLFFLCFFFVFLCFFFVLSFFFLCSFFVLSSFLLCLFFVPSLTLLCASLFLLVHSLFYSSSLASNCVFFCYPNLLPSINKLKLVQFVMITKLFWLA